MMEEMRETTNGRN